MLISRRAFRLLIALSIGTASARSYAQEPEWQSEAEAYSAAAVCPYGACHTGRDYLADPAPAPIEAASADSSAVDEVSSETAPADSIAAEYAIAEAQAAEASAAEPTAPAATETPATETPATESADNRGCGYDGIHPAYGHPYYGHTYYQHLPYTQGNAGYGYYAVPAEQASASEQPVAAEAPVATETLVVSEPAATQPNAIEPEATQQIVADELTCEYPATAPAEAIESIDNELGADESVAAESAIIEDGVPPTPIEESIPEAPQSDLDEAQIASEATDTSAATERGVVELAEEPLDAAEATSAPNEETVISDAANSEAPVDSLAPSPYPYGNGHSIYSSKGYPFHFRNHPYDQNIAARIEVAPEANDVPAADDSAAAAIEPSVPATDSATLDAAPEYEWEATANSNCDQDEVLLQESQATAAPLEAANAHDASSDDDSSVNYSDLLPSTDLPNYDYPTESQPAAVTPTEASATIDIDQFEQDCQWPAPQPVATHLIDNSIANSIAQLGQITIVVQSCIDQIVVPASLISGWESFRDTAAAQFESAAITAEQEPQIDQQTDISNQRDAVLALAQSIDRIGMSLQQLARQMERIADDDMIGRLGNPSNHIER